MTLDVTWDGVPLAKGATAREQDGGWFVELEQPMPVGTTVVVSGDLQATLAVARVHEGTGAGMVLKSVVSNQSSVVSNGSEDDTKESPEGGGKKEKRKKKR